MPSPDKAYTRNGPAPNWPPGGFAGLGRTGRGGVAFGGGAADAGGFGRTKASVTAPWPGSPTALRAGALRPPPPPPKEDGGSMAEVGRATPVVIPPGQASVPAFDGVVEANRFSHSIRPRSVSIVKTASELLPTNPNIRNPRYPIKSSSVAGGASEFNCLCLLSSLSFHRSWKPGFRFGSCNDSFEIFASALTQSERCASPLLVIQSTPRWAFASPVQATRQAIQTMRAPASLLIKTLLLLFVSFAIFTSPLFSALLIRQSLI